MIGRMAVGLVVGARLWPVTASAATFDLGGQWSDSINPNGAWTYREGANALPFVASWESGVFGGAWAPTGSEFLPAWFKADADSLGMCAPCATG